MEAIYIHNNDLVGIDQLAKEDTRNIVLKEPSAEEVREWTKFVSHIWQVPDDGRLPLRFQKRMLFDQNMRVPTDHVPAGLYLQRLAIDDRQIPTPEVYSAPSTLATSNLTISDYFDQDLGVRYEVSLKFSLSHAA